jgi:hypothetical protein
MLYMFISIKRGCLFKIKAASLFIGIFVKVQNFHKDKIPINLVMKTGLREG